MDNDNVFVTNEEDIPDGKYVYMSIEEVNQPDWNLRDKSHIATTDFHRKNIPLFEQWYPQWEFVEDDDHSIEE